MLTKKAQTKSNRLKPKASMKNKCKINDEDKRYLEYLQHQILGCMVCKTSLGVEYHHVKEHSTDRKDHKRLIPLCYYHHRTSNDLSAHGTPKKFKKLYSMEAQYELADSIYNRYLSEIN